MFVVSEYVHAGLPIVILQANTREEIEKMYFDHREKMIKNSEEEMEISDRAASDKYGYAYEAEEKTKIHPRTFEEAVELTKDNYYEDAAYLSEPGSNIVFYESISSFDTQFVIQKIPGYIYKSNL